MLGLREEPIEGSSRRFPPPWQVEQTSGGFNVLDASGQALAYVYARETREQVDIAKVLTLDEARALPSMLLNCPNCWELQLIELNRGETRMSLSPPSQVTCILSVLLAVLALLVRYADAAIPLVREHSFETMLVAFLLLLAGVLFRGF
jgi:hypothetical protein